MFYYDIDPIEYKEYSIEKLVEINDLWIKIMNIQTNLILAINTYWKDLDETTKINVIKKVKNYHNVFITQICELYDTTESEILLPFIEIYAAA